MNTRARFVSMLAALAVAAGGASLSVDSAFAAEKDKGKKGGGKSPSNAKLVLGIAQLHKGDRESARSTFKSLSNDKALGKVASVWTLRSYN